MSKRKETLQEALERIHTGKHPVSTVKKRKASRIILLVDIVLVILIMIFVYNRVPEKFYSSTSINYGGMQYRFSVTREGKENEYLFSLTIKNNLHVAKKVAYKNAIAELIIYYGKEEIYKAKTGDNITHLELLPGELKIFISRIDSSILDGFMSEHPDYIVSTKRSLFSRSKDYIPFTALATINLKEKISTTLKFNHEAQ
jgi:hypothetical protein